MESSIRQSFNEIVKSAGDIYCSHLCEGEPNSAMVWDPVSEITVRLSLREDEVWIIAGSGTLVRFIATSESCFSSDDVLAAINSILSGGAIEFFGVQGDASADIFCTGYDLGERAGASGGLRQTESRFHARIAGPLAQANLELD
ncbi:MULTISPECIES: hypothetical protein [unclassified Leucobacter]|uniref:hypothetical protein n=1 Tax=unclassified Leucobacter TaxID=2621730 RepID=UPI0012DFEF2A|nr:hypothetical protein [Leucobacter sp. Ag1]